MLVVARLEWDEELDAKQRKINYRAAIVLNDFSTVGVFVITTVNIFIASFISHGKAYVPPTDPKLDWNVRMMQSQRGAWLSTQSQGTATWSSAAP